MRKRWIAGGIIGVLFAGSVTGIAIHSEWLQGRWDAAQAATALADTLKNLDGVTSAEVNYDPFGLPDHTVDVSVAFLPNTAAARWRAAAALVRKAESSAALRDTILIATFREPGTKVSATVYPLLFEPEVVASEISAWRALRKVVGDVVSLRLGPPPASPSTLRVRQYTVADSDDMYEVATRWPAQLPAVDSSIPTGWTAPGIVLGLPPSASVMSVVAALAGTLPLADGDPESKQKGIFVGIADFQGVRVGILPIGVDDLKNGEMDPRVPEAVRKAIEAGAVGIDWQSPAHNGSLRIGDCGAYTDDLGQPVQMTLNTNDDDRWLASELEKAGLILPPNAHAGRCMPPDLPRL